MGIVRIKRSNTVGSVPASLLQGELAFNLPDQKLYAVDEENMVKYINFTSDLEKVLSGPIAQALGNLQADVDSKLDNNSSSFVNAVDDAEAATKGVVLNGFYRNGNVVMTRIV